MIVFLEKGRLGNQLFQYSVLKTLAGSETLCLLGFDQLFSVFDGVEARKAVRSNSILYRLLNFARPTVERFVVRSRIVSTIREVYIAGKPSPLIEAGLVRSIKYGMTAYFQSDLLFTPDAIRQLRIKEQFIERATSQLRAMAVGGRKVIFVHVRLRDYLTFPDVEYPAAVPDAWYWKCIDEIRSSIASPFFVFVSDDPVSVRRTFGALTDCAFASGDYAEDFALMAGCDGGILSPSSYSWWAAYLAHRKDPSARFLAPLFWAGHRRGVWFPEGLEARHLEFRQV